MKIKDLHNERAARENMESCDVSDKAKPDAGT